MTTLLQINASINNGNGQSSQLAKQFVAAFLQRHPDTNVVVRDVAAAEPVPHLNAERFAAFLTPGTAQRCPADGGGVFRCPHRRIERGRCHRSGTADVQLRGAVPAQSVFRSCRPRRRDIQVHRDGPGRPAHRQEGLCVRSTRRRLRRYAAGHPDGYIRDFLRFLGMSDVEFIYAEGLHISPQSKQAGLAKAASDIERLAA